MSDHAPRQGNESTIASLGPVTETSIDNNVAIASTSIVSTLYPAQANSLDVVNPLSGFFDWFGNQEFLTLPGTQVTYKRWTWRQLVNPTTGEFDDTAAGKLYTAVQNAANAGKRLAFRVQPLLMEDTEPGVNGGGVGVPGTLRGAITRELYLDEPKPKYICVPKWNTSAFQNAYAAFYDKLSAFVSNPYVAQHIAWIDIGTYGKWGEGHMYYEHWEQAYHRTLPNAGPDAPHVVADLTEIKASPQTQVWLTNLVLQRFPNIRKVTLTDARAMLEQALNHSPEIGWRRDCLGWTKFDQDLSNLPFPLKDQVLTRYTTAPVVTEFGGVVDPEVPTDTVPIELERSLADVKKYHVAGFPNGNLEGVSSSAHHPLIEALQLNAGFRPSIESLRITYTPNVSFVIKAGWLNYGTTPAYKLPDLLASSASFVEGWDVVYELVGSNNVVLWQGKSKLALSQLYQTTTQQFHTDTFPALKLPLPTVATLWVKIVQRPINLGPHPAVALPIYSLPAARLHNIMLALECRDANLRYPLGTVKFVQLEQPDV